MAEQVSSPQNETAEALETCKGLTREKVIPLVSGGGTSHTSFFLGLFLAMSLGEESALPHW